MQTYFQCIVSLYLARLSVNMTQLIPSLKKSVCTVETSSDWTQRKTPVWMRLAARKINEDKSLVSRAVAARSHGASNQTCQQSGGAAKTPLPPLAVIPGPVQTPDTGGWHCRGGYLTDEEAARGIHTLAYCLEARPEGGESKFSPFIRRTRDGRKYQHCWEAMILCSLTHLLSLRSWSTFQHVWLQINCTHSDRTQ